jgi:hypothetical protein
MGDGSPRLISIGADALLNAAVDDENFNQCIVANF